MKWLERWHLKIAPWEGFLVAHIQYEAFKGPNAWGWTSKGFMTPWGASQYAREMVARPEVRHSVIYFHLWKWSKGQKYRVVLKNGMILKDFQPKG